MARSVDDFIVDFSLEEEGGGGGSQHFKKGFYKVKIVSAKTGVSENKATPYLELTMAFLEGNYRKAKKKIPERLYISSKAMRRFRILLQALEMKVPAKLNAAKLAGKVKGKNLVIEIDDEPAREGYEDRGPRSRVTFEGFYPEDFEPDEEDEDEDEEDEDEDLEDDEDEEEEDEDEDLEDDEDEEDEEEEEPAPKKKRAAAKTKAKPAAKKKAPARKRKAKVDDEEELDELDLDDL